MIRIEECEGPFAFRQASRFLASSRIISISMTSCGIVLAFLETNPAIPLPSLVSTRQRPRPRLRTWQGREARAALAGDAGRDALRAIARWPRVPRAEWPAVPAGEHRPSPQRFTPRPKRPRGRREASRTEQTWRPSRPGAALWCGRDPAARLRGFPRAERPLGPSGNLAPAERSPRSFSAVAAHRLGQIVAS